MAMARKCDRCEKFYMENKKNPMLNDIASGVQILRKNHERVLKTFDFCDSCMDNFLKFILEYEKDGAPTPEESEGTTNVNSNGKKM